MASPARLTPDQARRMVLAAQGFAAPRPKGRVDVRHFRGVLSRVSVVQIDSVNVLARAHYLPFFSRLGPYPREALDRWLWDSGEMFEYWAHAASLVPVELRPLLAHRMDAEWGPRTEEVLRDGKEAVDRVLAEIGEQGPLRAADLDDDQRTRGTWWDWSETKTVLEYLFLAGRLTVAGRRNFERLYDLPERVHPAEVLARPPLPREEAYRELLALAARACGVGTLHDLADYHRLRLNIARGIVADMVRAGELVEVEVDGWGRRAYAHPEATLPRRVSGRALLAPFDPLVWYRDRTERLFDFFYRIEIYTPAPKRVYGYYVLPFLLGDTIVGRVDVKADRATGTLEVRGAYAEPGVDLDHAARELWCELRDMARWLDLAHVRVDPRGELAPALAATEEGAGDG